MVIMAAMVEVQQLAKVAEAEVLEQLVVKLQMLVVTLVVAV
jgi:hypothetical protein